MNIINDVLPVEQADWLEEMLTSPEIKWSYIPASSGNIPDGQRKFPSFSHPIMNLHDRNQVPDREMLMRFESINHTISKKAELDIDRLNRVRLGMHIPNVWDSYHGVHTDQIIPHDVILYYVNNSDGDTYFFDDDRQVIDRVTPKKNTMVVFDGFTEHASSYPSQGQRITINFNFGK